MPLVYVIILNYNGRRWLEPCLESLLQTDGANYLVMVVDNGSTDGSLVSAKSRFPQIEMIENHRNLGFSEGNNIGIRAALAAGADYIVLLNPDTRVEPAWLKELIAVGEADARIGILGAVQLEYESDEFNSWTKSAAGAHLAELSRPAEARRLIPMEWVEGACFAVKRSVFESVGLLDPIYFAFYEEIDLCRRAICCGFGVGLVPASRIHHHRGGSWEADAAIKRERDYRCDRSQFIYASTDPRRTLAGNLCWYGITLGTKLKSQFRRPAGFIDLGKMQIELLLAASSILGKWRRDRVLLNTSRRKSAEGSMDRV